MSSPFVIPFAFRIHFALIPQSYGAYMTRTPLPSLNHSCSWSRTASGSQGRTVRSIASSRGVDVADEESGTKSRWYHFRIMDSWTVRVVAFTVGLCVGVGVFVCRCRCVFRGWDYVRFNLIVVGFVQHRTHPPTHRQTRGSISIGMRHTFGSRQKRLGRGPQLLVQPARLVEPDGRAGKRPTIEGEVDARVQGDGPRSPRVVGRLQDEVPGRPKAPAQGVGARAVVPQQPVLQVIERQREPRHAVGRGAEEAGACEGGGGPVREGVCLCTVDVPHVNRGRR